MTTARSMKANIDDEGEIERLSKRIEFGIQSLIQKKHQILLNNEFIEHLASAIDERLQKQEHELVLNLLSELGEIAAGEDGLFRERSISVLSQFLHCLLSENESWLIQDIVRILTDWLRIETEYSPTYNDVCEQLLSWGKTMLGKGCFQEIDYLLMTLHHIESGHLEKSGTIINRIVRLQQQLASYDIVADLLKASLAEDKSFSREAGTLLTHMGPSVTEYLVDTLLECESKKQRMQLIQMITANGQSISGQLVDRLETESPWYVIRNIIMVMSMIDDPSLFPDIKTFLLHEDIRVQQQAIHYIEKEGKDRKKHYLIEALFIVCEQLKLKLVMQLAGMGGEDVMQAFMDLLDLRKNFSKRFEQELIISLCIGLEDATQERAANIMKQIIKERKNLGLTGDKIVVTAKSSLNKIEPQLRHVYEKGAGGEDEYEDNLDELVSFTMSHNRASFEEQITDLLEEGQYRVVEEMLYDEALSALNNQDFTFAEQLRDRMLQVSPDEMSRVNKLSSMIEQKNDQTAVDTDIDIWAELKKIFTEDEFNHFYQSLQQREYDNDEIIVRHGNVDPCLYFIKSGFVNLTCLCGDYETFLKRLQKGDIIGAASFFDVSAWSVTLIAQKNVHLNYLKFEDFIQLTRKFPELEKKLYDFSAAKDQIQDLLEMSGEERRQAPRFQINAIIKNILLDRFGIVGRRVFRSEINGISTGGLSCLTRINKRENARLLLGRMIISQIETDVNKQLQCKGTIIGVKARKNRELYYSIHVRFDSPLLQSSVAAIVNYNKVTG